MCFSLFDWLNFGITLMALLSRLSRRYFLPRRVCRTLLIEYNGLSSFSTSQQITPSTTSWQNVSFFGAAKPLEMQDVSWKSLFGNVSASVTDCVQPKPMECPNNALNGWSLFPFDYILSDELCRNHTGNQANISTKHLATQTEAWISGS